MRIAVIHSRYGSGSVSGENRVVEDEVTLLRNGGHDVVVWAPETEDGGLAQTVGMGVRSVWSGRARSKLRTLVSEFNPDVIHAHNLYPQLSPAVLSATEVPTVVTLHNYRLMCLPGTLRRESSVCESCLGRQPWRGVVHRCYRGSALASAAVAGSLTVHRALGTFDRVSAYVAVSDFVRDRHVAAGLDPTKVWVKPNFAFGTPHRVGAGSSFLYMGRLSEEKGVTELLELWRSVPDLTLRIAGDGPEREKLQASAPAGVEFLGRLTPGELQAELRRTRALLVPTQWYEGAPRVVPEAFAAGVPVVATRIGALPGMITDGVDGYICGARDLRGWAWAVQNLTDDARSIQMGKEALATWAREYSPQRAINLSEALYTRIRGVGSVRSAGLADDAVAVGSRPAKGGA